MVEIGLFRAREQSRSFDDVLARKRASENQEEIPILMPLSMSLLLVVHEWKLGIYIVDVDVAVACCCRRRSQVWNGKRQETNQIGWVLAREERIMGIDKRQAAIARSSNRNRNEAASDFELLLQRRRSLNIIFRCSSGIRFRAAAATTWKLEHHLRGNCSKRQAAIAATIASGHRNQKKQLQEAISSSNRKRQAAIANSNNRRTYRHGQIILVSKRSTIVNAV